ncbi:DNA topoisomerase III [Marchantia polymorpha subsp. ruderalis]|uniref:DNA topoisomerase n=2 Tax=Marchantia polymorpha TaxID=3197 RepID=A0AAF6AKS7_MARPO|nr:hypothetical protein MARPO_0113s0011 [Marchantia polymorpha]BBM97047.1 hypothetical protein Mp_1g02630 [Marchantia polymorpha subsp. ruderalis]|eukprot:PTQ31269.1 hypothetical protein MARPO_0113s0011 [Marchantia polymorpha]
MAVPRVLNVAEKPSVAKAVAGILSHNQVHVREGRSPYNKIFEFSYSIGGQPCLMLMTSVTGHLMEMDFEDQYRKWHSCDPAVLYQAPIRKRVPEDKLALQRTLQEEARRCQRLVLWLDCDREGENIAYEVVEVCQGSNPRLDIWRAHFSALIERDIHHAAQHLGRPNKMFADAVDARQEIDLRIGASFTRFQTMLLKDSFILPYADEERKMVLSYGPCQFPTLGFVVERYWQVQAHVPEEFWAINCSYSANEGSCQFVWMRGRLFDHLAASVIYEMCLEDSTATVIQVTGQETRKFPPCPLNTVELQKRCSRNFRMGSEQIMKVAEELYQSGFISYPRTETDSFSENTDLQAMVLAQTGHSTWGAYAQRLLDPASNLWRQPSNGGHNDKAHPPIHPTRFSEGESNWSHDHRRVYELVVRHYLACVSQPAIGYKSTASIDIAGETFTATGLMITAKNYLEVYIYDSWGTSTLPTFEIGQQFVPDSLTLDSGMTMPPPLLSEADLISLMDKAGIGTDATMHDHIKKILDRRYATKDANTRFSPTNLGEALVMGYDSMGYELWKPYLRAMMENDMKAVSEGTKSKDVVLASCLQQMQDCFLDARQKKEKLCEAMELFFERAQGGRTQGGEAIGEFVRCCPTCQQSNMLLKKRQDGNYFVSCSGYPLCRDVVWLPNAISEASVQSQACEVCGPGQVFKIRFKFRRAEIPPQYSTDYTGCVGGCDDILKEIIEMCGTGSRPSAGGIRSGGSNSSVTNRRTGQGNATNYSTEGSSGRACSNCGQLGHYSTDCPRGQGQGSGRRQSGSTAAGSNEDIRCSCNEQCVLLTANTEANRGRQFYGCPSRTCGFFLWEDAGQNSGRVPQSTVTRRSNSFSGSTNTRAQSGQGVSRANGSRGRGRTTISTTNRTSQTSSRGRRGQSSGRANQGSTNSERGSCYICGDSSHWSNTCPSRN